MSGSSARRSKPRIAPPGGGQVAELAMQVARLSETVSRQAEAIRILADRVSTLEGKDDMGTDAEPTHYLNGKPKF